MALKFRRGTTAQKSGSLAFGEPYVNTTLGTLQIGGPDGDITLGSTGTGSTGTFGAISGSGLNITGNAKIDGNLTLGGQLTIGDNTSDTVNVVASLSSSLIPSVDNVFDLGSQTKIWRDLYISTGSINVVAAGAILSSITTNADGSQTFPNGLYSQANIIIGSGSYVNIGKFEIGRRGDTPDNNTVLGIDVMPDLTTGQFNTGIGRGTLYNLTTGGNNIAMGDQAGYSMVNGVGNITIGKSAAFTLADPGGVNGQPVSNTFVGDGVGGYVNSGFYTTAIGGNALLGQNGVTDRFIKNTAIGYGAGSYLTGIATNNLYLGANAGPSSYTNESYKFYVSNGEVGNQPFMYGDMTNSSRTLDINASTTISGSLSVSTLTGIGNVTTYSTSVDSRIVTNANSAAGAFASASAYSASAATALNNASSSAFSAFAKLSGGNTFTGNQIVSASVYVTGDMIVYGSSSLQNVTASAVSIGTNTVVLNTSTPSVRFGGIQVIDSGSTSATGSLFWDSQNDVWVYVNPTGSSYVSARLLSGPKSLTLGSEPTLTNTNVPKVDDGDHLVDSQITDDGTTVKVVNAISASTFTGLGNLTTYSTSVDSRIVTNLNSAAGAFASASAFSASAAVVAQTNANSAAGAFASASAFSASAATTYARVGTENTFTANQIINATLTLSSSAAVELTVVGNQVITGSLTATGDVVAFSTSDRRHKNNIVLISDALSKVTKLNGVTWEWNDDVDAATKETPKTGLIAQEVQEVLPEVVKERADGFLALDYSKTIGLLVEAIKEQQQQIHSLTLEIEKLKKDNSL